MRPQPKGVPQNTRKMAATSSHDEVSGLDEFLNQYEIGEMLKPVCAGFVCLSSFFVVIFLHKFIFSSKKRY